MTFATWRAIHRTASAAIAIIGVIHCALTPVFYDGWGPDAVWFLGTGVGLITIAAVNWAHVGLEPCSLPTAIVVRPLNWLYVLLAVGAVVAVPEPQAFVLVAAFVAQAVASHFTLNP